MELAFPLLLDAVTTDDVVRAGACRSGVCTARDRYAPFQTVADVGSLLADVPDEMQSYVTTAAGMSGYGRGNGGYGGSSYGGVMYSGDGDGYGYIGYGYRGYGGHGFDNGNCGDGDYGDGDYGENEG